MNHPFERSCLQSKKFIAYLIADISWTLLVGFAIWQQDETKLFNTTMLMTMVIVKGFVQTGYVLGQSYVDAYTRTTALTTGILKKSDPENTI